MESCTSCPAGTLTLSRAQAAIGTCSASATRHKWRRTPSLTPSSGRTERSSITSRSTMRSATRWRPELIKATAVLGGSRAGGDLVPLATADYSSYLIKAQAANPDVIMFLLGGDDMTNALKQAVQFGLEKKVHLAGAQQELEPLEGLPPEARIGTWVMEWYWKQPGVPHVAEFVEATKKRTGRVPTARTWFGYVSVWTCALAAAKANSLKALDMARPCKTFICPRKLRSGRIRPSTAPAKSAACVALCGRGPAERFSPRRLVQSHQGGRRRQGRRDARGERLQDDVAGIKWPGAVGFTISHQVKDVGRRLGTGPTGYSGYSLRARGPSRRVRPGLPAAFTGSWLTAFNRRTRCPAGKKPDCWRGAGLGGGWEGPAVKIELSPGAPRGLRTDIAPVPSLEKRNAKLPVHPSRLRRRERQIRRAWGLCSRARRATIYPQRRASPSPSPRACEGGQEVPGEGQEVLQDRGGSSCLVWSSVQPPKPSSPLHPAAAFRFRPSFPPTFQASRQATVGHSMAA